MKIFRYLNTGAHALGYPGHNWMMDATKNSQGNLYDFKSDVESN